MAPDSREGYLKSVVQKNKKLLLHLSPLAAFGGCEINCLRIIQGLPAYRHTVVVFGGRGPMSAQWEAAGATVVHLDAWEKGRGLFKLVLAAWAHGTEQPAGIYYWSSSRLSLVLQCLNDWPARWAVYLGNPVAPGVVLRARLLLEQIARATPRNITLVACSQQVATSHRGAFFFGRFATEVIYNAVGGEFDRNRIHRALPIGSRPRIGMVARLDVIKDHLTIIRALGEMRAVRDDVVIEFAGEGGLREMLQQEAVRLGVERRVQFLGSVSAVAERIAGWDIYVHSTTVAEGMGTAVAEAMMNGLPCVVSDISVMREVCGDDGAVYAPPAQPAAWSAVLLELIMNQERRVAHGHAAQQRARALFALPQVAAQYLQIVAQNTKEGTS